jgi:hypothetical protein
MNSVLMEPMDKGSLDLAASKASSFPELMKLIRAVPTLQGEKLWKPLAFYFAVH